MVTVEAAPLAVGVTVDGLKVQVAPLGSPEQLNAVAVEKPPSEVRVTVAVAVSPGVMALGVRVEDAILKSPTASAKDA
jgi:hypothetical protein